MVPSDENNQFSALRLRRNRRVPYVNQACIECKRKKIKCDGVSPSSSLSHSKTQSKVSYEASSSQSSCST
ncbi:hypothetical protein CGCSCA1_v014160 [Colletotrichum siamense]|nr:hypothetical protein CGCSCA1_v014160 [Colletotrichum siamense]